MKNKVVIITGATSGIGRACAFEYGSKGALVVVTGRDQEKLNRLSDDLTGSNIEHHSILAEASSKNDNKKMVKETIAKFGRIDALIANAGIGMRALFEDIDLSVFLKVMEVNFNGTVYATKYALPHILESKGSIIGISSINGHRGTPARTAYTASKYAMEGFFESLRTEVFKRGVHVLVVSPGFTSSNIRNIALSADGTSQGESPKDENKLMSSEAVAVAIYKAHKKRKRDIVLTVQGKMAVFFNKWIPSVLDNITYNMMLKESDSPMKGKT
ncbi:MAG: SDR family oxidoreductase [Bacteroidetes bacterium]|nr:SDR family oxidoreductase [Bacteroidota bacterium]MDA1119367.1 SDR family oxidoreductase [Bacteroidota bacterium]